MMQSSFTDIPPGKIAAVVTTLEMRAPPAPRDAPGSFELIHRRDITAEDYRALFRHVGADWLWFSRLAMTDAQLAAILGDPDVEVRVLMRDGRAEGLLELDFRTQGACELAFLGLGPALLGAGAGRWLMQRAIARAWSRPIACFWVHTCTFDHPAALPFYLRSGFVPVRREIEIADDPRLAGLLPRDAAPAVPIIVA